MLRAIDRVPKVWRNASAEALKSLSVRVVRQYALP
jgi:hypothetical protein